MRCAYLGYDLSEIGLHRAQCPWREAPSSARIASAIGTAAKALRAAPRPWRTALRRCAARSNGSQALPFTQTGEGNNAQRRLGDASRINVIRRRSCGAAVTVLTRAIQCARPSTKAFGARLFGPASLFARAPARVVCQQRKLPAARRKPLTRISRQSAVQSAKELAVEAAPAKSGKRQATSRSYTSRFDTFNALSSMNARRGSTTSPISVEKI